MKPMAGLIRLADMALEAVFPAVCEVCGEPLVDGEEMICLTCGIKLPRTHIHRDPFNEIHRRLAAPHLPVDRAASYFYYYRGNEYTRLIHKAKYNYRPGIARRLGHMFAVELMADGFFDGMDMMIPIPLHWRKRAMRGYNQSCEICKGISEVTGIPINDSALKARRHSTQTRRNAVERLKNVEGVISVSHPEELYGKHLLIVDDVITTGATMITALRAIAATAPAVKVSVLSLALTKI